MYHFCRYFFLCFLFHSEYSQYLFFYFFRNILFLKLENSRKLIIITVNTEKDDIVISILDNAGGIKENIINKIFDAYFTTKESTGGTGIGLNMSKSIVEKHMNGKLKVFNKKFEYENITYNGANFKVILPKK